MSDKQKVVVVGASLGGLKVVEYLRKGDFSGDITLIGDEPHLPYDRPPLSKKVIFDDDATVESIELRERSWDDLDVEVVTGEKIVSIDTGDRFVTGQSGTEYPYDALFLATGVEPRCLPDQPDVENVLVVRRWEDSDALRLELRDAEKVAVIGGGFIGCEVAAAAREKGKDVVIVEASETLMQRGLSRRWGQYMEDVHRSHGVDVRTNQLVTGFNVEGNRATSVTINEDSELEADVFVVGIGAFPDTGWIEEAGIECDDGVVCDAFCESSAEDVYAVGDVARWYHEGYGRTVRVEHWTNADEMAKAAVANFLAEDEEGKTAFTPVPMVWSDQFDLRIQVAGEIADVQTHDEFSDLEESVHFGDVESGEFVVIQRDKDAVHGVLSINRASVLVRVKMALEKGASAERVMQFIEKQEARFMRAQKARE
jgi:NADPH-dependent 2,4-dienoyl-CoA reductase/sulfur reductase-like enzyme